MSFILTEEYNIVVNCEELIGTTEYMAQWARCRINRCRYNRFRLYLLLEFSWYCELKTFISMLKLYIILNKIKDFYTAGCIVGISHSSGKP